MDGYDLFGDDVGGSMLDSLADLGTDAFSTPTQTSLATSNTNVIPQASNALDPIMYNQPSYTQLGGVVTNQQPMAQTKLGHYGEYGDYGGPSHYVLQPSQTQQPAYQNTRMAYAAGTYPSGTPAQQAPDQQHSAYHHHQQELMSSGNMIRATAQRTPAPTQFNAYRPTTDSMYSMQQQQQPMQINQGRWTTQSAAGTYPNAAATVLPTPAAQPTYANMSVAYRPTQQTQQQQSFNCIPNNQRLMGQYSQTAAMMAQNIPQNYPAHMAARQQSQQFSQSLQGYTNIQPPQHQFPGSEYSHRPTGTTAIPNRMPHPYYTGNSQYSVNSQQPYMMQNQPQLQQAQQQVTPRMNQTLMSGTDVSQQPYSGMVATNHVSNHLQQQPTSIPNGSPQYRTPYPQLSPQMSQLSPRPQMSPRAQMSPMSVSHSPHPMQPNPSPLPPTTPVSSPAHPPQPPTSSPPSISSLQQLEQMVLPHVASPKTPLPPTVMSPANSMGPRTPLSPIMGPRTPLSPQQWQSPRPVSSLRMSNICPSPIAENSNSNSLPPNSTPISTISQTLATNEVTSDPTPILKTTDNIKEPIESELPVLTVTSENLEPTTITLSISECSNTSTVTTSSEQHNLSFEEKPTISVTVSSPIAPTTTVTSTTTETEGSMTSTPTIIAEPKPPQTTQPQEAIPQYHPGTHCTIRPAFPSTPQYPPNPNSFQSASLPLQSGGSASTTMRPNYQMRPPMMGPYNQYTPDNPPPGFNQQPFRHHYGPMPNPMGMPPNSQFPQQGPNQHYNMGAPVSGPMTDMPEQRPLFELQQVQQRLMQLYNMARTPQVQQEISDLQDRLRILQQQPQPPPLSQVPPTNIVPPSSQVMPPQQVQGPPQGIPPNVIPPMQGMQVLPPHPAFQGMPGPMPMPPNTVSGGVLESDQEGATDIPPVATTEGEGEGGIQLHPTPSCEGGWPFPPDTTMQTNPGMTKLENDYLGDMGGMMDPSMMEPTVGKGKKRKGTGEKKPKQPKTPKPKKEAAEKKPKKPRASTPRKKKGQVESYAEFDPTFDNPDAFFPLTDTTGDESMGIKTESGPGSESGGPTIPASVTALGENGAPSITEVGLDGEGTSTDTPVTETAVPATPASKKKKAPKVKSVTPSKKRPSKTLLNFGKKKRRRTSGSDISEVMGGTPPPSPEPDDENAIQKRRSARNTHRKKYVDDIDLAILEDENAIAAAVANAEGEITGGLLEPLLGAAISTSNNAVSTSNENDTPRGVKPNFVYINPSDEDTMLIQHILAVRMGRREIIASSDEDDDDEGETEKKIEIEDSDKEKGTEETVTKEDIVTMESPKVNGDNSESIVSEESDKKVTDRDNKSKFVDVYDFDESEKLENGMEEKTIKSENGERTINSKPKSDIVDDTSEDPPSAQTPIVKIKNKKPKNEPQMTEVEEYYVKYRNFSYLHCEWKTEEEFYKGDKRIASKIKRFRQKMSQNSNIFEFLEEDPFNPDYVEVDRILDVSEQSDPNTGTTTKHYLVKWRSLAYEDSTWELEDDVDPIKTRQFEEWRKPPSKDKLKINKKKPKPEEWKKLDKSPEYNNDNILREYQLEGLNWLLFSWYNGRNCILADEMGLGKTVQSIAFIQAVVNYGIRNPFLVIAPLSTIPNWQREFEAWTDLNVIVYHGTTASRNMIQEYEMFYKDDRVNRIKEVYKFQVIITTFEIIITDCLELREVPWKLCIIDEAHRLKNKNCKLLEGLRLLNLEHRVLLSGTPLQNNVNELFSLLNFLEPTQFTCNETFLQEFGDLKSETQVQKLQALLKPMMLRRLKEDVEKSIAPKEETIVEVELTNIQKKYYRAILEKNFAFISKGTTYANVPNLMNTMMELRKCCIHPYLLNGAEEQIQLDYRVVHSVQKEDHDLYYKALINSSGKMVLVDKLLPKLKANGHRVLVFSQMVRCLDILEDYLIYRKYPYERIDGRIRGNLRQAAIDRFCKPESDRFVFLLCTKAGGLGINLTAADTVIIYDSDWNPQNDLQAQARCHRIGQQKMVKVYRLICRSTYEREMFDRASLKLGLDKAVLQSMNTGVLTPAQLASGQAPPGKQLSKKEIEDLLKKGAYGAVMDEDNAGDKFCEEDIEQILSRRTQVITLQEEKGSTFSKASFASSGIRKDIDIDDPDFWKKWAKKAEIDTEGLERKNNLVINEPRRRNQIKRYGHDEAVMEMSELESSSDSEDDGAGGRRSKGGRQGRRTRSMRNYDEDYSADDTHVEYGNWCKSDCFKVEKGLLTFGWGRWLEAMHHCQFRKCWKESDVEDCARIILLFCLKYYKGDDKIKGFIWDLITPSENGESKVHRNHMGLSAPVPRGRKGKKKQKEARIVTAHIEVNDWTKEEKYDSEAFLESSYKKHLVRHANKVLLRVRMLYYIKHEIIGELVPQVTGGIPHIELPIYPPPCDQPPLPWWDAEADKSLLLGTYKHGYERYIVMRLDPGLCFLSRCGPPDGAAVLAEINAQHANEEDLDKNPDEEDDTLDTPNQLVPTGFDMSRSTPAKLEERDEHGRVVWPSMSDLNTRLRRIITSYQRNYKKEELRLAQRARRMERREKIEQIVREREKHKMEVQQKKWSRREEAEFLRTVSTFGVEYNRKLHCYEWNRFRAISRLDRKYDETLTEYFKAFYAMCRRTCGNKLTEDEEYDLLQVSVETVSEDRAHKILNRIDLLSKVREEILNHSLLDERLRLCQPSIDLPEWWVVGKHDKDLVIGGARHGLGRTDFFILNDPDLSFKEILQRHLAGEPLVDHTVKAELKKLREEVKRQEDKKENKKEEKILKEEMNKDENKEVKPKRKHRRKEETSQKKEEVKVKEVLKENRRKEQVHSDEEKENNEINEPNEESREAQENEEKIESGENQKEKANVEEKVQNKESNEHDDEDDKEMSKENNIEKKEDNAKAEDTDKKEDPEEDDVPDDDISKEDAEKRKKESKDDSDQEGKEESEKDNETENVEKKDVSDIPCIKGKPELEVTLIKQEVEEKMDVDENEEEIEPKKEIKKEETKIKKRKNVEEIKPNDANKDELIITLVKKEDTKKEELDKPNKLSRSRHKQEEQKDDKLYITRSRNIDDIENKLKFALRGQPSIYSVSQIDDYVSQYGDCQDILSEPNIAHLLAQSYQNPIRWPKDRVLQLRLEHIVHAVENNEWPVSKYFSMFSAGGADIDSTPHGTPDATPHRDTSTPMSEVSENLTTPLYNSYRGSVAEESSSNNVSAVASPIPQHMVVPIPSHIPSPYSGGNSSRRGRRRRIAIDVETERAKLRAILNNSMHQSLTIQKITSAAGTGLLRGDISAEDSQSEDSRSTPAPTVPVSTSSMHPPPAHQHHSTPQARNSQSLGTLDLSLRNTTITPIPAPTKGGSNGNNDGAMDLSGGLKSSPSADSPKPPMATAMDLQAKNMAKPKSNLEDMVDKLKKRKIDEPQTKEKKRRKLDEIVLGLSAAKGQSLIPRDAPAVTSSPSVKPTIQLNATSTMPIASMLPQIPGLKDLTKTPFTSSIADYSLPASLSLLTGITTAKTNPTAAHSFSLPSISISSSQQQSLLKGKGLSSAAADLSHHLHHHLQQHPKSFLDLPSKSDLSRLAELAAPKFDMFSQENKVKNWLAEQANLTLERPPTPDYLDGRRRRSRQPRMDPMMMDWNRLTGEEHVTVMNRLTGKKVTGAKAPQLKHLAQWLLENPLYDVDPKWAELVKERGNLPNDLLNRRLTNEKKKGPGRPPLMSSASSASVAGLVSSSQSLPSSSASLFSTAGLPFSGLSPSLLASLPLGGALDPKNPLSFLPFGGLHGLGNLGSMSNLGLGNPLFAGLPGFGLPSMTLGVGDLGLPVTTSTETSTKASNTQKESRKDDKQSKKSTSNTSGASSLYPGLSAATSQSLPFLFPNPSLMYHPLGLGSLPFSLPPGMPSAFANLAQSGLLNGLSGLPTTMPPTSYANTYVTSATVTKPTATASHMSSRPAKAHSQQPSISHQHLVAPPPVESDDESLRSLMGQHRDDEDDLPDDEPNEYAERVIIKSSQDLEKEFQRQNRETRRELRSRTRERTQGSEPKVSRSGGSARHSKKDVSPKAKKRVSEESTESANVPSTSSGSTFRKVNENVEETVKDTLRSEAPVKLTDEMDQNTKA